MKSPLRFFAALLLIVLPALSNAESRKGVFEFNFDMSAHDPGKELRLWIPYPVSDGDQDITRVKVSGDYAESAVYTDRVNRTPMLYARWPGGSSSRKIAFSFAADRKEVSRKNLPVTEPPWNPADYAQWLAPTSLGPTTGTVAELAAKITYGKTGILEKARAIYSWVAENTYRKPETRGCGTGDVCKLLTDPGGKCADISSVFVALARAAGVPSREILGIRMGSKDGEDITGYQHCWAEFLLPGYGWVPVDPADVRKLMLKDNLKNGDEAAAKLRERFWAGIDASRIKLSDGRDLVLNPPQAGAPVNYLMYPYAELGGEPLDWLDSKSFSYRIVFRGE